MILIAVCAFRGDQVKNNFHSNHHIFVAPLEEPNECHKLSLCHVRTNKVRKVSERVLTFKDSRLLGGFTAPEEQPKVS